jgi:hypothetical protein
MAWSVRGPIPHTKWATFFRPLLGQMGTWAFPVFTPTPEI